MASLAAPAVLLAQTAPDPAEDARLHVGPLALTPRFAIRNLGVDTNVFNSPTDPKRDFTATLGPALDAWLRVGRARLSSKSSLEWSYFKDAAQQRAMNVSQEGRIELDLATFTPFAAGGVLNTRQRPNLEIDARVRQKRTTAAAGGRVRLGGRSEVEVEVRRDEIDFSDPRFGDVTLAKALNRSVSEGAATFRFEVTPLTTFVFRAGAAYDVFEFSRFRDSDSLVVLPGFEFKPFALIAGRAQVGFRKFDAKSPQVPDYSGVIAAVNISYVMREMTKFSVKVDRNLDYSFELEQPYFVLTAVGLEVMQALGYDWDVVGRISAGALAYQGLIGGTTPSTTRRDRVASVGFGVGRRLGEIIRIGFDVDRGERRSDVPERAYEGFRFGGSFTYGY